MTAFSRTLNRSNESGKLESGINSSGINPPVLLSRLNIASGLVNGGGWTFAAQDGATVTKLNDGTDDFIRGTYDDNTANGTSAWVQVRYTFPYRFETDIYVQYWARKTPGGGSKMCKFYGQRSGDNQANATYTMEYLTGDVSYIGYGDGAGTNPVQNDTSNGVATFTPNFISTGRAGPLPRTVVNGGMFTAADWGDGSVWHKFQLRLKRNYGTSAADEINDGIVEMRINDTVRARGVNIYNRHWSNAPLDFVEFLSYAQQNTPFTLDVKNITISKHGWID